MSQRWMIALILVAARVATCAEDARPDFVHRLAEFGDTAKQLTQTCLKAVAELRKNGGVLEVSATEWKSLKGSTPALQGLTRTPDAPAETKRWADGMGVTVLAHDG